MNARLDKLVALAARASRPVQGLDEWFRIDNANSDRATVYVYDMIGEFGVTADQFVRDIKAITARHIDLHVNSTGGDVFGAIAMHAALVNHPAKVTTRVDGVAASAASFLAMAGDEIAIEKPAKFMIHDASGLTLGTEVEHRQMADLLSEISDTIAGIYADRAGGTVADWRDRMRAETWFSSAEAVAAGLADRVLNDTTSTPDSAASGAQDRRTQLIRARARAMALKG